MKIMSSIALVLSVSIGVAQTGSKSGIKPATKPAAKPTVPVLKNFFDSLSYCIGLNVARSFSQGGFDKINTALVAKAMNDVLNRKNMLIEERNAETLLYNYMNDLQAKKAAEAAEPVIQQGETFLKNNKLKPTVKVTASGLQYEILKDTVGYKPSPKDTFVVHYRGSLLDGREFDNSYNRGEPLVFPMNKVIPGWTEGLQLMSIGSHYKFYVPYQLGYGLYGSEPAIPGGAVLIFDLELLDVKKYKDPNSPKGNQ